MVRRMKTAMAVLIGLAALPALPAGAAALEIVTPGGGALARDADLQALRNQIQRQQFQQQQQQNRMQDRRIAPPPVLEVPKVQPTCRIRIYGNNYLKNCR